MCSGQLRASWHLWVPAGYTGAAPQGWVGFDLSVVGPTGNGLLRASEDPEVAVTGKVRNGHARGVAAIIVQLIDCSLAAVASEQGRGGSDLRLPGGRTGWAGRGDLPVCGLAWWTESGTEQTFPLAENSVNVNARLVGRSRSFPPACLWSSQ